MSSILGAVLLLSLTGCAETTATAHELPSSASDAGTFAKNLSATQELVGGEWLVRDDPSGRSCAVPSGGAGESIPALRISVASPETPEPAATAAAVASAWTQWGYSVTQSVSQHSIGEVAEVQGRQASGEYLIFRASANALTLQGESTCESTS